MAGTQKVDRFEPTRAWRASVALIAGATVFALDYVTKVFVRHSIALTGESISILPGILSFRFVANTGAAFSMGEGMGLAFAALAAAVVIAIAWYLARTPQVSKVETCGMGLVAGGAIGNAIDRVALGYVVDFIATDFIDFPVFNVADIGICVGVFLAFAGFMFLSPAAKVDATAELNARDRADARRREARRARRGHRSAEACSSPHAKAPEASSGAGQHPDRAAGGDA